MKSKILISGINGFVGSNLKPHLQKKYNIVGLSRNPKKLNELKINSITDKDFNNVFAFIHLAGKAHDLKKTSKENEYFEVNTELTKKLYNAFLSSNCSMFIYMSSVKAVADTVVGKLTENVISAPKTAYGKSKLAAENYILNNLPNNKKVYVLRPCMIHGPGNKGNLNLLYSFIKKGIPFPLGNYKNQRSFLSIDNLSFVISEILQENLPQGVYNVADTDTLSTNQLVKAIANADNKKAIVLKVPKQIICMVAKVGNKFSFIPLNSEKLQKLTENYIVDNTKLLKALQKPLPLSVTQGISKTIKNFN